MIFLRALCGNLLTSLRALTRPRAFLLLLLGLAALAWFLPACVQGDGSPEGETALAISYGLGAAFLILLPAVLWTASVAVPIEISAHREMLVAVRPGGTFAELAGRWLALVLLSALALAVAFGAVMFRVGSKNPGCRSVSDPALPAPEAEAREMLARFKRAGGLPEDLSEDQLLAVLTARAPDRYEDIRPGERKEWDFSFAEPVPPGVPLTLRLRFESEDNMRAKLRGIVSLRSPAASVDVPLDDFTQSEILLDFSLPGEEPLTRLSVGFTLDGKSPASILLRPRRDVKILAPGGTFAGNALRAALLQLSVLATVAALGLLVGACFSAPTAAFCATLLLLLATVSSAVVASVSVEERDSPMRRLGYAISERVDSVVSAAVRTSPLTDLSVGERIGGAAATRQLATDFGVFPLVFLALGALALRRRNVVAGEE